MTALDPAPGAARLLRTDTHEWSSVAPESADDSFCLLIENVSEPAAIHDGAVIVHANRAAAALLGAADPEQLIGRPVSGFVAADRRACARRWCRDACERRGPAPMVQERLVRMDGRAIDAELTTIPFEYRGHIAALCLARDVTLRSSRDALRAGQNEVLERIAAGFPLDDVLISLAALVEAHAEGGFCSVLLLGEDGIHVQDVVAPRLSSEYRRAMVGAAIGPRAGSCGTAMYLRAPVIVTDIRTDPRWEDYRTLAEANGLRACWSTPILSHQGDVLGSFGIHYREPRAPDDEERQLIEMAGHLAGIAIERQRAEQALRRSEEDLRRSSEVVRELAGRLIAAQEAERRRISRDLHDDLNQKAALLSIAVGDLRRELGAPAGDGAVRALLDQLQTGARDLASDIRQLSHQLHPATLEHAGLVAAVQSFVAEFAHREGIDIRLTVPDGDMPVPREVALCLYRVAQEALRNIARHSGASRGSVTLAVYRGKVRLRIRDRGRGFDPEGIERGTGLGLVSMEERVRLVQGSLKVASRPGRGTVVWAVVPIAAPAPFPTI